MKTIKLSGGGYEAEILPAFGGNCVRLCELSTGAEILRTPLCERAMEETPLLYGTPLLVPPNRIRGGTFEYKGRKYVFPLNEPEHGNHCHGELYRTPAEIAFLSESEASFRFTSDEKNPYLGFPHPCRLTLTYALSGLGLSQTLRIENLDGVPMPFAAAFHTTFNLAFEGGDAEEYSLRMPVEREFLREMTDFLPTGETDENFEEKEALNGGTWKPEEHGITKFTELSGTDCEIIHGKTGNREYISPIRCINSGIFSTAGAGNLSVSNRRPAASTG